MRKFLGLVGLAVLLAGCGGAGGESHSSLPISVASSERGTAVFDVDVETGKVKVSPLTPDTNSRAVLVGSSVSFTTTTLLNDGGEVGRRALQVKLTNNLSEAIGVGRPIRIQFGVIGPALSYAYDLRSLATVSSPIRVSGAASQANISSPTAVAVGFDGSIYFNGTDNRIRKLQDGYVSTVATNVSASGLAYLRDTATGSEYLVAPSSTLHSVKLIAITSGNVTTWAGLDSTSGNANGTPDTARFNAPRGVTIDNSQSQALIADSGNGLIRTVTYSFIGGTPVATDVSTRYSSLSAPYSVAVSSNRSVAVVERLNHRVRIFPGGSPKPVAFGGTLGNVVGDGNVAQFSNPWGVTAVGDAFIVADAGNNLLKRLALKSGAAAGIANSWVVSVLAGSGASGFIDGSGTIANFGNIAHLATDNQSHVLVADNGANGIRQINSEGSFDFGAPDGSGTGQAILTNPTGFADLNGLQRPYIDINQRVEPGQTIDIGQWQFAIPSEVKAFRFSVTVEAPTSVYAPLEAVLNPSGGAGSPNVTAQFLSRGISNGAYTGKLDSVGFDSVSSYFATDSKGVLYSADALARTIRRIDPDGTVTLIAGKVGVSGSTDGQGTVARFGVPDGLVVNSAGTEIIVADELNHTIRRIGLSYNGADPRETTNWYVSTIAGASGTPGDVNGTGDLARFRGPVAVVGPSNDELYITEYTGFRLRRLRFLGGPRDAATSWESSNAAGTGVGGYVDGTPGSARFGNLVGAAYGADGKVYICDRGNRVIRAYDTLSSQVTTFAGSGVYGLGDNAIALSATFANPSSVTTDASGAVYVGDATRLRRILNGSVKTVAGGGDGSGTTGDKVNFVNIYGTGLNAQGDLLLNSNGRLVRLTRRIGR
jgi:hypothetical protein